MPRIFATLDLNEICQFWIRFEDVNYGFSDQRVGDLGVDGPGSNIAAERGPMLLEEPDCANEAGGENCADPEDFLVLAEAAEELGIHALVGVRAEDGLVWAGVVCVRVIGPFFEVGAFVIACENGASQKASRCLGLGFYEQKVHSFAFV